MQILLPVSLRTPTPVGHCSHGVELRVDDNLAVGLLSKPLENLSLNGNGLS